jgi:hypothetical protein
MSTWRVAQHYGFGAGRIPIQPEPHRVTSSGLREGFADLRSEFVDGGVAAMVRRVVGQSPSILLLLLLTVAMFNTLLRDHSDVSPIEIVLLEDAPPPIEELAELVPEPIPLVEEAPKPIEVVPPKPLPPLKLAEKPKPPPPAAKPHVPKPPVMPEIARVEKPPPPKIERPNRPQRARPLPAAKPRVAVAAIAPRVESIRETAPRRTERMAAVSRPVRPDAPRLDAPAAPRLNAPSDDPPPRGFRVARTENAAPTRVPQVKLALAPTPQSPAALVPEVPSRTRADAPRPKARSRAVSVAPALAAAQVQRSIEENVTPSRRDDRPVPKATSRRGPRPTAAMAVAPVRPRDPVEPPTPARVTRATQQQAPRGASDSRPGVAGVPLADLAVCMSDRDEDRLKQAVVAAVTTQKECVSRAGTYRFVETKNLNSFLMWIDRAASRSVGDRCDELRHALECLQGTSQRAAR